MINAKDFFKKLKAITTRKNLRSTYQPSPKGLSDARYFEALDVGLGFTKDCSSVITGQEALKKIITQIEYIKDSDRMSDDG